MIDDENGSSEEIAQDPGLRSNREGIPCQSRLASP